MYCQTCKLEHSQGNKFCIQCGKPLVFKLPEREIPDPQPKRICPKCSIPYDVGKKYCKQCGSTLIEIKTVCPNCQAPLSLEPNEKFCLACGAPIPRMGIQVNRQQPSMSLFKSPFTIIMTALGSIVVALTAMVLLYHYCDFKLPYMEKPLQWIESKIWKIDSPQIPYEDYDVCSGESCIFGEWIACQNMEIYKERNENSPVVFHVNKREVVNALTGVVIITKPGRAKVLKSFKIGDSEVVPGDVIYLLTYRGEGVYNVWFKGSVYNNLGLDPFNLGYLDIMDSPETIDWVQIQNSKGQIGWRRLSRQSYFDYKYGCD